MAKITQMATTASTEVVSLKQSTRRDCEQGNECNTTLYWHLGNLQGILISRSSKVILQVEDFSNFKMC